MNGKQVSDAVCLCVEKTHTYRKTKVSSQVYVSNLIGLRAPGPGLSEYLLYPHSAAAAAAAAAAVENVYIA